MDTRTQESQLRLKHLVEEVVNEQVSSHSKGLWLAVNEVRTAGRPLEHIRVWATLHFLPQGSPFCCCQPQGHLWLFGECLTRISDLVRRRSQTTW